MQHIVWASGLCDDKTAVREGSRQMVQVAMPQARPDFVLWPCDTRVILRLHKRMVNEASDTRGRCWPGLNEL